MSKTIDWKATQEHAKRMSDEALAYARRDAFETAQLWNDPSTDPDGNAGFYMDQVSVYKAEQDLRSRRTEAI